MRRWVTVGAVALVAAGAVPAVARAPRIREYRVPTRHSFPSGIAAGADGAIWFTEQGADRIGRLPVSGARRPRRR